MERENANIQIYDEKYGRKGELRIEEMRGIRSMLGNMERRRDRGKMQ